MNTKNSTSPASGSEPARPDRLTLPAGSPPITVSSALAVSSAVVSSPSRRSIRFLTPFLLAGLLLTAAPAGARAQDSWFGPDKFLHFTASFLITSAGYVVARDGWEWDHDRARAFGVGLGIAAGIGKEFYDLLVKRTYFSGRDLVWDGLGIGAGVITANLLRDSLGPDPADSAALMLHRFGPAGYVRAGDRRYHRSSDWFPDRYLFTVDTGLHQSTLRLPRGTFLPGSFTSGGD